MTASSFSRNISSKRKILLTASALVGTLAAYGREAVAATEDVCTNISGSDFVCTGNSSSAQTVNASNANVSTENPLTITTDGETALSISGSGDIVFEDPASSDTSLNIVTEDYAADALYIASNGDDGTSGTGSVTVTTAANINSAGGGLYARNNSSGAMSITVSGDIVSERVGLETNNRTDSSGQSVQVDGSITSTYSAIRLYDSGSGDIGLTMNGNVTSTYRDAVYIYNESGDISISVDSKIDGYFSGIQVQSRNEGDVIIDVNADVEGYADNAIAVRKTYTSGEVYYGPSEYEYYEIGLAAGDVIVTTAAGTTVAGGHTAVRLRSYAYGDVELNLYGDAVGDIYMRHYGTGDMIANIDGDVEGGISIRHEEYGDIDASVDGDAEYASIRHYGSVGDISISVGSGSNLESLVVANRAGNITVDFDGTINSGSSYSAFTAYLRGYDSEERSVDINIGSTGRIYGAESTSGSAYAAQNSAALRAAAYGDSDVNIVTESGSIIEGSSGIVAKYSGDTEITVGGDVVGTANDGIHIVRGNGATINVLSTGYVASQGEDNTISYDSKYRYLSNEDRAIEIVGSAGDVTVAGTVVGGAGGAIVFDAERSDTKYGSFGSSPRGTIMLSFYDSVDDSAGLRSSYDDRLELQPGFSITGIVDAGGGYDQLVLGGEGTGIFDISLVDNDGANDGNDQYFKFDDYYKEDGSTWTLTGSNSEIYNFAINGGILYNDADMSDTDFDIVSGATIGGNGRIGTVDLPSGARLAPGTLGTIGTLDATNVIFEEGSIFAIDLLPDGTSDLLTLTAPDEETPILGPDFAPGSVLINGGTISISGPAAIFSSSTTWTIISAEGGVTGTFDEVVDDIPDVEFYDIYDAPNLVQLGTTGGGGAGGLSDKSNAPATSNGAGFGSMNFAQSIGQYAIASPNGYMGGSNTLSLRNAIGRKSSSLSGLLQDDDGGTRQLGDSGLEMALIGLASHIDQDATNNSAGYDADSLGGAAMLGYRSSNSVSMFNIGAALGYTTSDVDVLAGSGDVDTTHLGIYSGYRNGAFSFTGSLAYGWMDVDLARIPLANVTARADTEGNVFSGYARLGYDILANGGRQDISATPFLQLRGYRAEIDGYSETGAGLLNLTVDDTKAKSLFVGFGMRLAKTFGADGDGLIMTPYLSVAFEHEFLGDNSVSTSTLAAVPGSSFSTPVGLENAELFSVETGGDLKLSDKLTAEFNYGGSFNSDYEEHRGSLGVKYRF